MPYSIVMIKNPCISLLILSIFIFPPRAGAASPKIIGPGMEVVSNDIILSSGITNVKEIETLIKSGVSKEIVFTIELLRSMRFWPDKFVVSKKITRVIRYDNLREQYWISSSEGSDLVEKSYRVYDSIKSWIFSVSNINLANMKELDPGQYYIRVIIETRSREHPPLIGFLMHLIPEVEMRLVKESEPFMVRGER